MEFDFTRIQQIVSASHSSSNDCAQAITDILLDALPLVACTFYSFYDKTGMLTLRSQTGFTYEEYSSFELPMSSIAGLAIREGRIIKRSGIGQEKYFQDKQLCSNYRLESIVAIPLQISKGDFPAHQFSQQNIGVLCLYPKASELANLTDTMLSSLVSSATKQYCPQNTIERLWVHAGPQTVSA